MVNKKIYYYNLGIHTYMDNLIKNPPKGYEFIVENDTKRKEIINKLKENKYLKFFYKSIIKKMFNVFGVVNKIYSKQSPKEADLILSTGAIINEQKPWILKILDTPFSLAGNDYKVFINNKDKLERALLSPYCKKIIVHTKRCKEHMNNYFCKEVINKVVIVSPAIKKNVEKINKKINKKIKFLFIGSINNPDEFYMKGGVESLKTFSELKKMYPEIELTMRCKIPEDVKKININGVKFIEEQLPWEELEQIYRESHVLLMPAYGGYFIMAYLEAFSYGIPIIALDTYGVNEFIINNKTGFYIPPSKHAPINAKEYPANTRSAKFIEIIKKGDSLVIDSLVNQCSKLIKNKKLIRKMSEECKNEFKTTYSFDKKIIKLKKIFDEALK